jgi:spore germination cell wall hydrolase CwlJ-like protein
MRFLVAVLALASASTPALASDLAASSRAIPPVEEAGLVETAAPAQAGMTDLVYRPRTPAILEETARAVQPSPPRRQDDVQQTCIAQAVYYESKGEPMRGQRAVADVIINRTKRPGFASTPCGVIRQPHQFTNASRWRIPSAADPLWQKAREIARNAIAGIGTVSTAITHFHASGVRPGWSMRRIAAIGGHVFY